MVMVELKGRSPTATNGEVEVIRHSGNVPGTTMSGTSACVVMRPEPVPNGGVGGLQSRLNVSDLCDEIRLSLHT